MVVVLLALSAVVATTPAAAQRVRGTVRDSASGEPIPGAVVWLTDSAGNFLARSVGDEKGRFAVMRLVGSARLHAVRIGFRPQELAFDPAANDTMFTLRMSTLPPLLAPMSASGRRVCGGAKGTGEALDAWEQARAALLASVVSREATPPSIRVVSFSRKIDALTGQVTHQSVRSRTQLGDRSYVAGRPGWAFAEEGYMLEAKNGERTFFAPDEGVLLDPTFAGTHCMHVIEGRGPRRDEVGIAFEPVGEHGRDTLVDITGVLWLRRGTPELRSMEFQYTSLEPAARGSGGEIVFRSMPNGAPMIERWSIKSAQIAFDNPSRAGELRHRLPDRVQRGSSRLLAYHEFGGAVAWSDWKGTHVPGTSLREVTGQVTQLNGRPGVGARVWLENTSDTTTTDSLGYFVIPDVVPGRYAVRAADSTLAAVGVTRGWAGVDATKQRVEPVLIFYFGVLEVLGARCHGQVIPDGTGILLGRVTDADGGAVLSARIEAHWSQTSPAADQLKPDRTADVDDDGRFAVCGAPMTQPVRLHGVSDAGTADMRVEWASRLMAVTLIVR
ncbi:MAG: hypothetical protein JWM41_3290 [Gemmatimonadetes bacterium]|nr:hypothetical protein [Gemmatimonadota bacterium]